MQPSASASGAQQPLRYPGESRRVLGVVQTPTVKVEEMAYAAGLCVARHSHDTANFIYTIAGAHWSGHSRGGEICAPRTVRLLPAGEPHENYFPVGCRCLHIGLRQPILEPCRRAWPHDFLTRRTRPAFRGCAVRAALPEFPS